MEHINRVVTRDELLDHIWAMTMMGRRERWTCTSRHSGRSCMMPEPRSRQCAAWAIGFKGKEDGKVNETMRKAILTKFIHLLFLALVLNTFIALVVTSSVLLKRSREDMHFALESVDRMLDYTGNVEEQLMDLSDLTNDNNSRYTLIRMDGTVVLIRK